ncbi:MAG: transposase [Vulcanimicrobiaceae bacterium]
MDTAILARLQAIFGNLAERWDYELLEFNGEPAPSVLVNNFKTVSLRLIRLMEPLVLHRQLRRRSALGAQAVRPRPSWRGERQALSALPGATALHHQPTAGHPAWLEHHAALW